MFTKSTNIRDHLGNLRMSLTRDNGQAVILQERHYYPFGLLHQGYNEEKHEIQYTEAEEDEIFTPQVVAGHYKYLYQEQERQEDLNLNWDSFKYRNYDYTIGRFMSVDPLAEKFPHFSPYQFAGNKPTWSRELEGLESAVDAMMMANAYNSSNEEGKKAWRESEKRMLLFFVRLTPIEDIYGVFTGKDFDGNDYNRGEAAAWAVMGLVPAGKFSKYLGKLKEFFKFEKAAERTLRVTNEIINDAKLLRITKKNTKILQKKGTFEDALKDFKKYKLKNFETIKDNSGNFVGYRGKTKDGKIIKVRNTSSHSDAPTLEILRETKDSEKAMIKIRYENE